MNGGKCPIIALVLCTGIGRHVLDWSCREPHGRGGRLSSTGVPEIDSGVPRSMVARAQSLSSGFSTGIGRHALYWVLFIPSGRGGRQVVQGSLRLTQGFPDEWWQVPNNCQRGYTSTGHRASRIGLGPVIFPSGRVGAFPSRRVGALFIAGVSRLPGACFIPLGVWAPFPLGVWAPCS